MANMLDDLDDRALDALPFGVVCLDEHGKVVRMNRTEETASGIQRWRAVGRSFFRDVAPGASNGSLAQQVAAFAASARPDPACVAHTFARRRGEDRTTIELVHGRVPERVYLCIHRA